jgi:hypothetical protein
MDKVQKYISFVNTDNYSDAIEGGQFMEKLSDSHVKKGLCFMQLTADCVSTYKKCFLEAFYRIYYHVATIIMKFR